MERLDKLEQNMVADMNAYVEKIDAFESELNERNRTWYERRKRAKKNAGDRGNLIAIIVGVLLAACAVCIGWTVLV